MTDLIRRGLRVAFPSAVWVRSMYRRVRQPVTVGVRALVIDGDRVLLVRSHGSPWWDMPGGGTKRRESLRAAAVREAHEETGCAIAAERLLGVYLSIHDGMTNHVAVYVCRATGQPTRALNIEIAEARWWPIDTLPSPTRPGLLRRLAEYQAGSYGTDSAW